MFDVLASQFRIAKFFWNKPNAIVFVEGLTENLIDADRTNYIEYRQELKSFQVAFSRGLPSVLGQLTEEQRQILCTNMAVPLLWILGRIKNVYSTGERSQQLKLVNTANELINSVRVKSLNQISLNECKLLYSVIFEEREKLAMAQIERFLRTKTDSPKEIYIVFGALHDFGRYVKKASGF